MLCSCKGWSMASVFIYTAVCYCLRFLIVRGTCLVQIQCVTKILLQFQHAITKYCHSQTIILSMKERERVFTFQGHSSPHQWAIAGNLRDTSASGTENSHYPPPTTWRIFQLPFFCVCRYVAALKIKSQKQDFCYHFMPIPSGSMGKTDFSEPFIGHIKFTIFIVAWNLALCWHWTD
jgi:hypothetical protein